MAAAKIMLDEIHIPLSQPSTDHNTYTLTISAATVMAHLLATLPSIRLGLMRVDIRLGDVVVSKPTATSGGLIQYDFGKSIPDRRAQRTGSLNAPPGILLTTMAQVEADAMLGRSPMNAVTLSALGQYLERDNSECSICDKCQLVNRSPRKAVMEDAQMRDQLAQELGVLCFEMEAAGLMDQLRCLVIPS
ncbi:hypothetical protein BDV29DRAFT_188764 [Aspergillus leporis]|uniref:Nucleoside phosphorylase domain-containing protein n=1 Tax=Aspergillus leporis TaxID=41062 RepID=A0A5N5X9B2_9EURO|nr:hypothetical protein BDV29DRAFT_188764 [Aspergillus leporis]